MLAFILTLLALPLAILAWVFFDPGVSGSCRGALCDSRLKRENRFLIFMHKGGLGDAFCQTGLMRAMRAENPDLRFVVFTRYPDFFRNLPEVAHLEDLSRLPAWRVRWLHWRLRLAGLERGHDFVYKPQRQVPKSWCDANPGRRPHLVELAAERLREPADFSDVRGHLVFSAEEESVFSAKHAALGEFAIVVPAGKTSYTPNKEWGFENYRRVTEALPELRWVQLGLAENPALDGAVDLRGRTGLREMAWLLGRARFVLCGEGLHNHLCGALGTPCFTVFSGFHYREIAAYPATIPLVADPLPSCAPCWLKTACPVAGKPCTGLIEPVRVAERIRHHLAGISA